MRLNASALVAAEVMGVAGLEHTQNPPRCFRHPAGGSDAFLVRRMLAGSWPPARADERQVFPGNCGASLQFRINQRVIPQFPGLSYGVNTASRCAARVLLGAGDVATRLHICRIAGRKHLYPAWEWPTFTTDAHTCRGTAAPDSMRAVDPRGVRPPLHISSFKLRSPAPKQ